MRSLYSLNKEVRETAVYPSAFSGQAGQNILKFKEKFLNALEANQIRERDKVEVLKKHLKGYPKESIGDDSDVTSITEAFQILEQTYGNTRGTPQSEILRRNATDLIFGRRKLWQKSVNL